MRKVKLVSEIEYRVGDALDIPHGKHVVVAHIVNNAGAFGRGFAAAVRDKWPHVRTHYLANFGYFRLGEVLFKDAEADGSVVVANLFAQDGLPSRDNPQPIRYGALREALEEVADILLEPPSWDDVYEVWMPRIGTGYAGGDWRAIEMIIRETLCAAGIKVVVFDLPNKEEN